MCVCVCVCVCVLHSSVCDPGFRLYTFLRHNA